MLEPAITFEALKVPLVDDLIARFSKSNEYQQLQLDHALVGSTIENKNIWQPFFDNAIKTIHACLATKKHALAAKQKVLTRCFEKLIVEFVDSNHSAFELVGQHDLPGHLRGVLRLHATSFLRILRREMCHRIVEGGTRIRLIVKEAFGTDIIQLRDKVVMRKSGRESLYYITGWLLGAALKAAKRREADVKEQLNMLVVKASSSREVAIEYNNLPTAKVERVEQFGGLRYANEEFFVFVERLEYVFVRTLTPELLVMNGSCLIDLVYSNLNTEDCVLNEVGKFLEVNVDEQIVAAVTNYLTRAYCRMRGKDFARKLMSKDGQSLKQTRRPTLAAASNPAMYKAKNKKAECVDADINNDNAVEYLLFDAATGNSTTEEKGCIDDSNLLEI